jgi:gamma-glutamyltranspeptidase/glutathione hydrolase/leukotriene-C4 hydrolase
MKRPKYADTLEIIASQGVDAFYKGVLADKIVKEIQDQGGIITKEDLVDYQVDFHEALNVSLNDSLTAFTTQAPSSGPLLTFILNILRGILNSFQICFHLSFCVLKDTVSMQMI